MVTLRKVHLLFILVIFIASDLFGAWCVASYSRSNERLALVIGILSFLFGFALAGYTIWLVHKLDQARIR